MPLTDAKLKGYIQRILFSRLRILNDYGFYGLMLMHMKFGIDDKAETAYTDAHKICFGPEFLEKLSDSELDFIMMHEIMHVVLKHVFRGRNYDPEKFNIACDIVVNSNILYSHNMDLSSITLKDYGVSMHTINGKEGYEYTAEEVYEMLPKVKRKPKNGKGSGDGSDGSTWDDHNHWEDATESLEGDGSYYEDEWEQRIIAAMESLQIKNSSRSRGMAPLGALRMVKDLKDSSVDWRKLLADFLSFEISDYSFTPPDHRYDSSPFYLPDFNEPEEVLDINILFEVDTSGSMSDDDLTDAYSEIKGAIDYGNGRLKGWLGFYDSEAYEPKPFTEVSDILDIRPVGGGGTWCASVFRKISSFENLMGKKPDAIIFLTDGYDSFPPEEARQNIPVFWLITNDDVTPPWGIVARMKHRK